MAGTNNADPLGVFGFVVELNGIQSGYFQEVSGLGAQIEIQEVQEGGRNDTTRKLVGPGKWSNIVLKRGLCVSTLLDMMTNFHQTKQRINGSIVMLSNKGTRVASWDFKNGVPVKWDGPQLNASQNAIAVETLEIAHEGIVQHSITSVDRSGQ